MMTIPPYTSIVAELQRNRTTDLDRYVRIEFGDRSAAWLADGVRLTPSDGASCDSEKNGRLLRRLTQAIATFF